MHICQKSPGDLAALVHMHVPCVPRHIVPQLNGWPLLMQGFFRPHFTGGAPPKTQTYRLWGKSSWRARYMLLAQKRGGALRVMCGQGNHATVGWATIDVMEWVCLQSCTAADCAREGFPGADPRNFLRQYLCRAALPYLPPRPGTRKGVACVLPARPAQAAVTPWTYAWKLVFQFYPCLHTV